MGRRVLFRGTDSQRQKVYDAEHGLFREAFARNISVVEAERTLKSLARRFRTTMPVLARLPGGAYTRSGDYRFGRIRVQRPRSATADQAVICYGTLVHEFAHHLNEENYGQQVVGHGPEFVRALRECMYVLGFRATVTRREHKVRVGSHRNFWSRVKARTRQDGRRGR